jgi:hypothetical protein
VTDGLGERFDSLDRQVDPFQLSPQLLDSLMEFLDVHARPIGRTVS